MSVRVDEPGNHEVAGRVDRGLRFGERGIRGEHRLDAIAPDRDGAALEDAPLRVHRHHGASVDEEVHGLLDCGRCGCREQED